jgi:hypothetical protein
MKAYVAPFPHSLSRGIWRVAEALAKYAPPGVEVVDDIRDADLVVMHLVGMTDTLGRILSLARPRQRYAIFQYCVATTEVPLNEWYPLWANAAVVATYYSLGQLTGGQDWAYYADRVNFYHTPLGVDTTVFTPHDTPKVYAVGTSGYVAGMECIDLWAHATAARGAKQFHLGPDLGLGDHVESRTGLTDAQLAKCWSACGYVSGLRRVEGFELPAYEGLACGARPVMFNRPDAHWLSDSAEYLDEDRDISPQLIELLGRPYRPVTPDEIAWVRERFAWEPIVRGFWERVL